ATLGGWRAVIDGEIPLYFHVGIQKPVEAEHDVVKGRSIHALVLQIEIGVANACLPGAPAVRVSPDVEVAVRDDAVKGGGLAVIRLMLAGQEVEKLDVRSLIEESAARDSRRRRRRRKNGVMDECGAV